MSDLTLYEISDHLVALLDSQDMCETDEQRAECEREIAAYVEQQVRKVDNYARYLAHLEDQANFAKLEIGRLQKRKAEMEARADKLRDYAVDVMQRIGLQKLEGETATFRLKTNPPAVEITDEELVDAKYKTLTITVPADRWEHAVDELKHGDAGAFDELLIWLEVRCSIRRAEIAKAIKGGATVPGADLAMGGVRLEVK